MGAFDTLMTNGDLISKGLNRILGKETVNSAYDNDDKMICFFYNFDLNSKKIIEYYLKKNDIPFKEMKSEVYKRRSVNYQNLVQKKVVLLDKQFCLYKDVVKLSQFTDIKGYTGKIPKFGINQYFTIKKT